MEMTSIGSLVMIPQEELNFLKNTQAEILSELKSLKGTTHKINGPVVKHITAKEFMTTVRICRSKFDKLVAARKIVTIKKKRKIYVPLAEVDRYFSDPSIQ